MPVSNWQKVKCPIDVILLEGWCLGAVAQTQSELSDPINDLEQNEDDHGVWRHSVNEALKTGLEMLYDDIDLWVMLRAPSFQCVFDWRLEQETKLKQRRPFVTEGTQANDRTMNEKDVARFIAHFERLTLHCLEALPEKVNHLYQLNESREVISHHVKTGRLV